MTKSAQRSHRISGSLRFSSRMGLTRRLAVIAGTAAALVVSFALPAFAHATYKSSNPPNKGSVSSAPSQITAEFTEPMTSGSYMDVTDPCGRDSGTGSSQTGSSMSVQNTSSAAGTYVVFWRAVSIDSHITEGEFTFTSTGGDPCPGEDEEEPTTGGGGGNGGNEGSNSGSSSVGSNNNSSNVAQPGGGSKKHAGHNKAQHQGRNSKARGGGGKASEGSTDGGPGPAAQPDDRPVPSALEGIPLDGVLITFTLAAMIGAAAGKIYVSLSGE